VLLPDDRDGILALDRSFTTDRVYRIVRTPQSFALAETIAQPPVRKEFPLEADLGEGRVWEQGLVAERADLIVGFAAFTHQRWNRRTELWHLYVAAQVRRQGVGRALVEAVIAAAEDAGMRCVWLETSNLAYPAIQFYRRMGFELCGLDASLYDPVGPAAGETALYFARPLPDARAAGRRRRSVGGTTT
jgi:ribosomal protein S18 acetylase RimI-like enzyme